VLLDLATSAADVDRVALPVTVSERALRLCATRDVDVVQTPLSSSALLETAAGADIAFAADRSGRYVFPRFLPAFDAAAALVRLVSLLGRTSEPLAARVDALPPMPVVHRAVPTRSEEKGLIMRTLMEQVSESGERVELIDGIKVMVEGGWALVVPDPLDPLTHVWAEGTDEAASSVLAEAYARRVQAIEG
jgi:mannose-1-phosphate guanylyltransferase/phosphomannomutase